mmetsp:Transcript_7571/g.16353  ORF Transcript_7571/g.16353 Transcript_7571/m.16353 type:complete len:106 (-) Transcript_7571:302-619(-)
MRSMSMTMSTTSSSSSSTMADKNNPRVYDLGMDFVDDKDGDDDDGDELKNKLLVARLDNFSDAPRWRIVDFVFDENATALPTAVARVEATMAILTRNNIWDCLLL